MASISAFDAKTRFGELLERVAQGEEIVITRHNRPVARIIPETRRSLDEVRQAVDGLHALRDQIATRLKSRRAKGSKRPTLTAAAVRDAIELGRL